MKKTEFFKYRTLKPIMFFQAYLNLKLIFNSNNEDESDKSGAFSSFENAAA